MKVICLDNLLTGNLNNISHLFENKNFKFINYDVTNYVHVSGNVDYILHFASAASPKDYLQYPIQTLKVGSLGTHKVLGLAKEKKAVFLLASTSEVYGDPVVHPQKEVYWGNVNPIGPRGVYDEAKRFAEAITMAYHRYHGLRTRIARIFNTYGPKMRADDGRAVPTFISQALANKPLTVFGNGSQTRSFCFVDDEIDGIIRLLLSTENNPVNIGNPEEVTLLNVAKEIIKLADSQSKVIFEKLPADDPQVRQPDISRARALLKWEPKTSRDTGLLKTIKYFREKLN